jgi:hypothetical protein
MNPHDALAMQRALVDGHSVLVRGELPAVLPIPPGWAALRVRCEPGARPFAPLRDAATRALQWIGEEHAIDSVGMMRVGDGARPEALARAINRLAARTPTGCALLFDQVDHADHDTLVLLRRWLSMPGSLRMPVVLAFSEGALSGEAQALRDTARELGAVEVQARSAPPQTPAGAAEAALGDWGAALQALGPDELMTLRAAAVLGARFEAADLAALRELPMVKTLELLQRARDLGAPLEDDGHEGLAIPEGLVRALRATVLPSLARHWQQRATARRSSPVMAVSPAVPARAQGAPPERVVLTPTTEAAVAPESAVRREAPQSRRRRVELDGTIDESGDFDEVAVAVDDD